MEKKLISKPLQLPSTDVYDRLAEMGLVLPEARQPLAEFVTYVCTGNLIYISGQGPVDTEGHRTGKVGATVSKEEAYNHARLAGINLLAVMKQATSDLRRVSRIVKVLGMVNAAPDFEEHSQVINGCSDLLVNIFGDAGLHARTAIGVASLPYQITVEVEAVIECK